MRLPQPWERVAELSFGLRPGEAPSRRLIAEIMGRYSNVILTQEPGGEVLQCAYQVRLLTTGMTSYCCPSMAMAGMHLPRIITGVHCPRCCNVRMLMSLTLHACCQEATQPV